MTSIGHQLWLASAGTGKTYRLTGHFLALLLNGVEPAQVLATTFTRKAAGEILDRVLERLLQASEGGAELEDLRAVSGLPGLEREHCLDLLVRLARGLDRFQVRTLDSFFVQLARLFTLDLELPSDWTIADSLVDAGLRAEALQRVLASGSRAERLELLRGLKGESASRAVHDAMLKVILDRREIYRAASPGAIDCVRPIPCPSADELEEAGAALASFELPKTQKGTPNSFWAKAMQVLLDELRGEDWEGLLAKGFIKNLLEGKLDYHRVEIPDELSDMLYPVIRAARSHCLERLIEQTRRTSELLALFEREYTQLQYRQGAYQFSDLPVALAPPGHGAGAIEERALDLWFRLDGRLDHLLLDEFQDTAPDQWRILAPLVDEILADGTGERSFFCVGDVKQSIYGFRQAEPRLLAGLDKRYPQLEAQPMLKSYRSSAVVLETVNAVFSKLSENAVFAGEERAPQREAALEFERDFGAHVAVHDLPGAARIVQCRAPAESESSHEVAILETVVERTRALLEEAPGAGVGILLRKGKWIPAMIHALRSGGVMASGEGGNPLTDSEGVLTILSLLLLADHPGDSAAAFHVESSALAAHVGLEAGADVEARGQLARRLRARLVDEGYGALVAELGDALIAGGVGEWDRMRLAQLIDLAYAWEERAGSRPQDFVLHVQGEKVATPLASRVRVMTIHKSKGLEFDAVLLPDLGEGLRIAPEGVLSRRSDPYGAIDELSAYNRKAELELDAKLAELHRHETRRNVGEALCVLYVAMTRAARCLELIVRPPSERQATGLTFQELVLDALKPAEREATGVIWSHPDSSARWGAAGAALAPPEVEPCPPDFRLAPTRALRAAVRHSPSHVKGASARALGLALGSREGARIGTLVHAMLEHVSWLDGTPIDEAWLRACALGRADDASIEAAARLLAQALESPELRAALSRPALEPGVELELRREESFALFLPSGPEAAHSQAGATGARQETLWSGSIDRLVLERVGGRVRRASILDFKTDLVSEAGLPAAVDHHRPQLEAYARVVAHQHELEAEAIECRLLFLRAGRVLSP